MAQIRKYLPVFRFVLVFGGLYLVLSLLYAWYLDQPWEGVNYPDPITSQVSHQVHLGLEAIGYEVRTMMAEPHPSIALFVGGELLYNVIDGCNAISVMILFSAFVLAFAKAIKPTALFLLVGLILLYIVNVLRLIGLALIYKHYREYAHFAHDILFPAAIYGMVVLLWIYWIRPSKTKESQPT